MVKDFWLLPEKHSAVIMENCKLYWMKSLKAYRFVKLRFSFSLELTLILFTCMSTEQSCID